MSLLDRVLLPIAPDVYFRRQSANAGQRLAQSLQPLWDEALRLPGAPSLEESFLQEIQEYFHLSREEALRKLDSGAANFAEHFAGVSPDLQSAEMLERVYDDTELEIFELAEWHARRFHDGPVNYALALRAARATGARRYLDYGSGIGSGAILFARQGLDVTLADVSSPMLRFARWRLERRGLPYRTTHLRNEPLTGGPWDVITLLDVLEHVADPLALVRSLRSHLANPHGLLVIRAPFEDERPQHIAHDMRTLSMLRPLGYGYAWEWMGERGLPVVVRPSNRSMAANALSGWIDRGLFGLASSALSRVRSARLKLLGRGAPVPSHSHHGSER